MQVSQHVLSTHVTQRHVLAIPCEITLKPGEEIFQVEQVDPRQGGGWIVYTKQAR